MVKLLLFTLLSFAFAFALAPALIWFLYKFQIGEEINRKLPEGHLKKEGTPTMAGLLIVLTAAFINLFFNLSRAETYLPIFALLTAGSLGAVDDILKIRNKKIIRAGNLAAQAVSFFKTSDLFNWRLLIKAPWNVFRETFKALGGSSSQIGFKAYHKYLFQLAIGLFFATWFYFKLDWHTYWLPLLGYVNLGWLFVPITIFLFTLFLNSVAITDGLDGLAGGLLLQVFASLGAVAFFQNQLGLAIFCATLVGALMSFLYFNFYPARVFMGNIGAHALGASAFVVSFMIHKELLVFLMGGIFVLEVVSDLVQIVFKKSGHGKFFKMAPLHHHFELSGWPETKVTQRFWLLGALFNLLGLLFSFI